MTNTPATTPLSGSRPPLGAFADLTSGDALAQADRVAAETLIRTTVLALANGAAIKDIDGLVQRNAGSVSHADARAGRLGSNVLGDIISTVEQAKGGSTFNWLAAPPEQIKAYLRCERLRSRPGATAHGGAGRERRKASGDA